MLLIGGYMNYYNEIKKQIINNEITKKVKDFIKNPIVIKNSNNYEVISEKNYKN